MSALSNLQMSELVQTHYFLGKTTKNILELAKDLEGLCCSLYLQMSELVQTHYFLGKTTKNRLELAKDLEGLTGNS